MVSRDKSAVGFYQDLFIRINLKLFFTVVHLLKNLLRFVCFNIRHRQTTVINCFYLGEHDEKTTCTNRLTGNFRIVIR